MKKYIYADKFFLKSSTKGPGYLAIEDGAFGDYMSELSDEERRYEIIDYSGKWIAPGLVDTHIHGFMGHDVMDNDPEGLKIMSEALLSCGVTSFLPTTLTSSKERLLAVSKTISQVKDQVTGAKIQGIYFEGPFFTEEHKGAQNPAYFGDPNLDTFQEWQDASGGIIKKIALAPERPGAKKFIEGVTKKGVVVGLGHSSATLEEAKTAVDAGASVFIHAYNAMSGLSHREPGLVGAMLSLNHVYSELICDGHHVHPCTVDILIKKAGPDHVALITDCMNAGGLPEGDYFLGEFPVVVKGGVARLQSGNLAASVLKLYEGMRNVVDWNIATPEQAVMMASYTPAVSCKIDHLCGSIQKERAADFIVLDENMNLCATYLDGVKKYQA